MPLTRVPQDPQPLVRRDESLGVPPAPSGGNFGPLHDRQLENLEQPLRHLKVALIAGLTGSRKYPG
jgi:hypothetical protein